MNLKQTVLASSMVAVFALPSFNAQASIYIGKAGKLDNYSAKIAVEQPLENSGKLTNYGTRFNVAIPVVPGYSTSAVNRLYYRIALKGGVKFNATPNLVCGTDNGSFVLANGQVSTTTAVGGSVINFLITSDVRMRVDERSAMCILSFKGTDLAYQVTDKIEKTISAVLQYKDGPDTKSASYAGSLISFAPSNAVVITASIPGGLTDVVVDVKESSKKFVVGGTNSSDTTATIATISYKKANVLPATAGLSLTGSSSLALDKLLKTATITVAGVPVVGSKGFFLVNAGNSCVGNAPVANGGLTVPVSDTVTFKSLTPAVLEAGVQLCMVLTSDVAIDGGVLTVSVGGTPQTGGWSPDFGLAKEVYELTKNGSVFRVLNIPNPANGDKAFIRLYNPTSASVKVRGSFIGQDGVAIGASQLIETVPAYAVKIIDAEKLKTLFGVTTWTGRARLIVEAESAIFSVQATIRTPNGILTNMGSETEAE